MYAPKSKYALNSSVRLKNHTYGMTSKVIHVLAHCYLPHQGEYAIQVPYTV